MNIAEELSLEGGWRIGEAAFARLVEELQRMDARRIIEFGSGVSSVRLAMALPDAHILSLESSLPFFEEVKELARRHGISEARLTLEHRPLRWQWHAGALYQSYARGNFPEVDAAIIDGPPSWTGRGREACLHGIVGHLRIGGKAFLDDFERLDEHITLGNWLRSYPGVFNVQTIPIGHTLAILEKVKEVSAPRYSGTVLVDSLLTTLRRGANRVQRTLRPRGAPPP
jgi:hypothetical protein